MVDIIMFAEIDANGWAAIIGAIGVIVLQVATMILSYMRDHAKILREKIAEVKVEEIHKATNSMKDALVETTRLAATLQGGVDERAKADLINAKLFAADGSNKIETKTL